MNFFLFFGFLLLSIFICCQFGLFKKSFHIGSLFRAISTRLTILLKLISLFITNSLKCVPYVAICHFYTRIQSCLGLAICNTPSGTELPGSVVFSWTLCVDTKFQTILFLPHKDSLKYRPLTCRTHLSCGL